MNIEMTKRYTITPMMISISYLDILRVSADAIHRFICAFDKYYLSCFISVAFAGGNRVFAGSFYASE